MNKIKSPVPVTSHIFLNPFILKAGQSVIFHIEILGVDDNAVDILIVNLTKPLAQRRSLKADSSSADQEIRRVLWMPVVKYHIHKSPPLFPVLSQFNVVNTLQSYFLLSPILICFPLLLGLVCGLFPSALPTKAPHTFFTQHARSVSSSFSSSSSLRGCLTQI